MASSSLAATPPATNNTNPRRARPASAREFSTAARNAKAIVRVSELSSARGLASDLVERWKPTSLHRPPAERWTATIADPAEDEAATSVRSGPALSAALSQRFSREEAEERAEAQEEKRKAAAERDRVLFAALPDDWMRLRPIAGRRIITPRDTWGNFPLAPPPRDRKKHSLVGSVEEDQITAATGGGGRKGDPDAVEQATLLREEVERQRTLKKLDNTSSWATKNGVALEGTLGFTGLVCVRYLLDIARAGKLLPAWQGVPAHAFATLTELRRTSGHRGLPVLYISHPIPEPTRWPHPDPHGHSLQALKPLFEAIVRYLDANGKGTWGVLWPFASFPQAGYSASARQRASYGDIFSGGPRRAVAGEYVAYTKGDPRFAEIRQGVFDDRSPRERARVALGRKHIHTFLAHSHVWTVFVDAPTTSRSSAAGRGVHEWRVATDVLRVASGVPPRSHAVHGSTISTASTSSAPETALDATPRLVASLDVPYNAHAWCLFDRHLSSVAKRPECLLTMRTFRPKAMATWGLIVEGCRAPKWPPLSPPEFNAMLKGGIESGAVAVARPADVKEVLLPAYEHGFNEALRDVRCYDLSALGWRDAEIVLLASALMHASAKGAGCDLSTLSLRGNRIGDEGARALATVIRSGTFDRLDQLDLSDNGIGDAGVDALARAIAASKFNAWGSVVLRGNRRINDQRMRHAIERALRQRQMNEIEGHEGGGGAEDMTTSGRTRS